MKVDGTNDDQWRCSGNIGADGDNDDQLETIMINWPYNGGNDDSNANDDIVSDGNITVSMVKIIPLVTLATLEPMAPVVCFRLAPMASLNGNVSSTFHTCHCTLK